MDIETIEAQTREVANQLIAERSKVDLYYLCSSILGGEGVLDPKVHGPLCRALRPLLFYKDPESIQGVEFPSDYGRTDEQGMPTPEEKIEFLAWQAQFMPSADTSAHEDKFNELINQLLALMPRGTLKSTIITIGFTIQWHLNYPDDRVLIDSEVFTKSKGFLAEIVGHYESNKKLRTIYGTLYKDENGLPLKPDRNRKFDTWSTEAINLSCRARKRKEPSIDCAGIDVTKNGFHYDLILGDDLHSEKNTKTREQIEKVKEHYRLLFSLLEPGGSIAIVGTRWDDDDLYQMIIDEEADEYNFITRSAEAEDGTLFYPSRLSRIFLDRRRKKNAYIYSCQYLNNPVDQENATFKKSMFNYITVAELLKIPTNRYGLVDPSYKGVKGKSDFAAFIIGEMGPRKEIYCRYAFKAKMIYSEIFNKMGEFDDLFEPRMWLVEVIGTKTLEHDFMRMQDERVMEGKRRLNIRYIRSRPNSKEDRIAALSPYYERGDAYHVSDGGGMIDALEGELMRYPKAKYDDLSDAWSDILGVGQAPRRIETDERTVQKQSRYIKMLKKPRSPVTGY